VTVRPQQRPGYRGDVSGSSAVRACAAAAFLLSLASVQSCGRAEHPPQIPSQSAAPTLKAAPVTPKPALPPVIPTGDFSAVTGLVDADIAEHRLPGAVIQVGHGGNVVFRQAYGSRKLPGEPGLDGLPSPAEPMTEDTMFDLASLTKIIVTTTAVLQLYEQGKVALDEPVQTYLPEFNPDGDPRRARVTVRMLLTHTSGIGGDLSRQAPWGLTAADKADGIHRAITAPLEFDPGETFHYSDIGFIILGTLVERFSGETLDVYAQQHIFTPLGMSDTRYLPAAKVCGPYRILGNAIAFDPGTTRPESCPEGTWSTDLLARIAPTARDEDTPGINPHFDRSLRSTVHDPTARRMGGVAGSAGVFSTAPDVGRYAQALLDRLAGRPSSFPLKRSTLELMTTPQQPPAVRDGVRGFGWDIDTYQSKPRGAVFPVGSFGHTGFTGVSVWMDPGSDSYVVVLANVIHQRGGPPIVTLSGDVATASARALHLYGS
jgi:CubicO group peptidase (beta-lactamase class C family)